MAELPVDSLVLAILRTIADMKQKEVESASNAAPGSVTYYERRQEPPPEVLSHYVRGGMGYPSYMIGRTRDLVEEALASRDPARSVSPEEIARREFEERAYAEFRDLMDRLDAVAEAHLEHREAPYLWRRLERHTAEERLALVKIDRDFWSPGLCVLVCEKSAEAAADVGQRAKELAQLALEISRRVPGGEARRAKLEGIAELFIGNSLRVCGQLPAADEAFNRSALLCSRGAGTFQELLDPSRPLDLKASLRLAQRRLPESLNLLEGAFSLARTSRARGRILLSKAKALEELGAPEEALAILRDAEPQVLQAGDPRQLLILAFNRLVLLCDLGRAGEAAAGLKEVKALEDRFQNELERVRYRWLEGRVAVGIGQSEEAATAFREVGEAFIRHEILYDSALVHLELAKVLLEEGRTAEVRALTVLLEPIFVSQGVHREALAALSLFIDAARKEQATVELTQGVFEFLRRSQHNSEVHFEGQKNGPSPEGMGKRTGEGTGK